MPNNNGKYFFPDDSILRNKTIVALTYWGDATKSPEDNSALASKGMQANSFITLKSNNLVMHDMLPLSIFAAVETDREVTILYLDELTPSKSFITVADPAASVVVNENFFLTFYYLD